MDMALEKRCVRLLFLFFFFVFTSEKVTPTRAMNSIRTIFLRKIWNYNMRAQWMAINKAQLRKKKKKLLLLHGKCTHDSLWHEHLCTRRTINRIVCCGECGRVYVRGVFAIVVGHVKETPPCCSLLTARRTYECVRVCVLCSNMLHVYHNITLPNCQSGELSFSYYVE